MSWTYGSPIDAKERQKCMCLTIKEITENYNEGIFWLDKAFILFQGVWDPILQYSRALCACICLCNYLQKDHCWIKFCSPNFAKKWNGGCKMLPCSIRPFKAQRSPIIGPLPPIKVDNKNKVNHQDRKAGKHSIKWTHLNYIHIERLVIVDFKV